MNIYIALESNTNPGIAQSISQLVDQISSDHNLDTTLASSHILLWRSSTGQSYFYQNDRFEIFLDGYIHGYKQNSFADFLTVLAQRIIQNKKTLEGDETGVFNILIYEKDNHRATLTCDPSGNLPVYYGVVGQNMIISSHLYILGKALNLEPDYLGILQKDLLGYTIGPRTAYSPIKRLQAAEMVVYSPEQRIFSSNYTQPYFTEYRETTSDFIDQLYASLITPFKHLSKSYQSMGVMLSEGFDSRLTAGLAQQAGFDVYTFSHGSKWTRGLKITQEVSRGLPSTHHIDGLERGYHSSLASLHKTLLLADDLTVPCFEYGSEYFSRKQIDVAVCGTALDSTLGANLFFLSKRNKARAVMQRYKEIAGQDLGILKREYVENLSLQLIAQACQQDPVRIERRVRSRFSPPVANELVKHIPGLVDDIQSELERIKNTGSQLPSLIIQRYFLENLARKSWFGQDLVMRINNRLATPVYEREFMQLSSALHPIYKLNHKTYLQLLRWFFPRLARINNGAYLLPATYPRLILETSRFWHVYTDEKIITRYLATQGRSGFSGYRGARFTDQTLRHPDTLNFFESMMNENQAIVNRSSMLQALERVRNYQTRTYLFDDYYRLFEACQIFGPSFLDNRTGKTYNSRSA